jgi:hypothetical protein
MMRTTSVTRYVTPLREGGSLPGIVEAADLGTYVCKFRRAGQGPKVLVAEVIVSGLAAALGLRTPDLVALELDPEIARYEADEEVQDLLDASAGLNLGVDFLPGAFGFDPDRVVDKEEAATVVWLDAFTANVDRSWRNPNLLVWHDDLWVIDHGASLYFHHAWSGGVTDPERFAAQHWDASDHVLGAYVDAVPGLDADLRPRLDQGLFEEILARVPDVWLEPVPGAETPEAARDAYVRFLAARLAAGGCGMSAPLSYQYVVLRCVPRPEREEFLNIGVVVHCQAADFLDVAWHVDRDRLKALAPGLDCAALDSALRFIEGVCAGDERGGVAARQPLGQRFGFVRAPRSTVVQPGPVHGGVTTDPAATLEHLLTRLVR